MKNKKVLLIIGIALIVILGIVALTMNKKEVPSEPVDELNENILKDTNIGTLKIIDQAVITRDGMSTYTANIVNESNEVYHIDNLYIVFHIGGEKIDALALQDTDVAANETLPIGIDFDRDISKTTKIEYENTKIEENTDVVDDITEENEEVVE